MEDTNSQIQEVQLILIRINKILKPPTILNTFWGKLKTKDKTKSSSNQREKTDCSQVYDS